MTTIVTVVDHKLNQMERLVDKVRIYVIMKVASWK